MDARVSSRGLVVSASFVALIVLIWGVLLDWHFVLGEDGLTLGQLGITALAYTAFISGWIWGLVRFQAESRNASYALLVYALLLCVYALQDLFVYCPSTCPKIWLYYIANWGNLMAGIVSAALIIRMLRGSSKT